MAKVPVVKSGSPIVLPSGSGYAPAVTENPCDCCDTNRVCYEACSGGLPANVSITIDGWTMDSYTRLNGTYLLSYDQNEPFVCSWIGNFQFEDFCEESPNNTLFVNAVVQLFVFGSNWLWELQLLSIIGAPTVFFGHPYRTPGDNPIYYGGSVTPQAICSGGDTLVSTQVETILGCNLFAGGQSQERPLTVLLTI